MKSISLTCYLVLTFCLAILQAEADTSIRCSHAELCNMLNLIVHENNLPGVSTETLVNISGDPHEYEPSTSEIKNLIKAPILLIGPNELNPWIKKIMFQRSKIAGLKTINLSLETSDLSLYPKASAETISHFWLYPKVYCALKSKLESELTLIHMEIKKPKLCDPKSIESTLQKALSKTKLPVILTHDALLPLMISLGPKSSTILAIKGSGHHEEVSTNSVKKMYDALKNKKVIWVQEAGINIPPNILNKIRSNDAVIVVDTAKTKNQSPFSVITDLSEKLNLLADQKQ